MNWSGVLRGPQHRNTSAETRESRGEGRGRCRSEGWHGEDVKPDGWRDGVGRRNAKLKTVADKGMESEKRR